MARPFVSVLIDTYNHERFIQEAVSSVLAQDFPAEDREILVVDDGSTDRTPEILRQFASQVRILRKSNGGQASAFNHAIPECRGEIIAFLDGDDWWAPSKLSSVITAFAANPSVGLIGHGITEVLPDGSYRSELLREVYRFRIDSVAGARAFRLRKSFLGTSRMACRPEILRRIGSVPNSLVIEADEFLFTLAALFSDTLILRESLTFYRHHGKNLFQISDGNHTAMRRKHAVLAALVDSLRSRFHVEGVRADISRAVLEAVQTEADVLRLSLDSCWPWETIRVELDNYRIMHENASPAHWLLKSLTLFPALFLSSKKYASLKQQFARNALYRKTREKVLPSLRPAHVDRNGRWGAQ